LSEAPELRLAMWSGPRNISTAMMRSWGNRPDTFVCDEPLYAHYLSRREVDHPGVREVLEHHERDWRKVVDWLTGPIPEGKGIFYQKHMTHHLLPHIDRGWMERLTHAFLIRDPREMLTSLVRHMARPRLSDTGLPQQVEIFEWVRERTGRIPPVLDAEDVLNRPEIALRSLCAAVGVEFSSCMLRWPPGPRPTDGVWARHWYKSVETSTGFRPYRPKPDPVPEGMEEIHSECQALYRVLHVHRLGARAGSQT
jgi:hypothetical protein